MYNMPIFLSRNFSGVFENVFFLKSFWFAVRIDELFSSMVVSRMQRAVPDKDAKHYDLRLWDPPMMQTDSGDVQ